MVLMIKWKEDWRRFDPRAFPLASPSNTCICCRRQRLLQRFQTKAGPSDDGVECRASSPPCSPCEYLSNCSPLFAALILYRRTSFWLDDRGLDPKRFSSPLNPARSAGAVDARGHPSSSGLAGTLSVAPEATVPLLLLLLLRSPLSVPSVTFSPVLPFPACLHSPSKQRSFRLCPLSVSLTSSRL